MFGFIKEEDFIQIDEELDDVYENFIFWKTDTFELENPGFNHKML
jgi:hypothetical protein